MYNLPLAEIAPGFNTWAREEPNGICRNYSRYRNVSILGLARSPTSAKTTEILRTLFQYLGSRGAQRRLLLKNRKDGLFQYLGSRGAQLKIALQIANVRSFNTWAREEPNVYPR